jgi:hypothetical protein
VGLVSSALTERLAMVPGIRFGALPAEPVRRLPTGIAPLDGLLGGGWPRGHVSEIAGGPSSGRTALLHAALAAATRCGEVVALIDVPDTLDPTSLARAGAALERVLWVRPPSLRAAVKCAELVLDAGGFGLVALDGIDEAPQAQTTARRRSLPRHVWPRLAHVTRRAGAVCLVCAPRRAVGGAAAVAVRLSQRRARWDGRLFAGIATTAVLERSRFGPAERAVVLAVGDRPSELDGVRVDALAESVTTGSGVEEGRAAAGATSG